MCEPQHWCPCLGAMGGHWLIHLLGAVQEHPQISSGIPICMGKAELAFSR